ncbi:hypothetical protein GHT06_017525 [Daphnia sinensis]|uniref:PH domain-containing protein n=1 Tax=Daphnia sinensis TaxID=1820382 RepID=A0AAD5L7T6_9CRUS|nr:hypothetical protein GHT06_017525 [Daphnia sinensis]
MAVEVDSWQRQEQQELRWDPVANCPDRSEMTQEVAYGHLMMVTSTGAGSPHRHRLSVFGRLYQTSAGRMLVLWPDKNHVPPIGCVTLKDTFVTSDESRSSITLRGQNDDDLPLTLICPNAEDFEQWKRALADRVTRNGTSSSLGRRKKFITNVVRLPMLIEEEM